MKNDYPTQDYLKECFDYNPETGELIWKVRPITHFANEGQFKRWNKRYAGQVTGYHNKAKESDTLYYKTVTLNNRVRKAHVLIWILVYGTRVNLIDHIDGNGLNNKIDNLRELSVSNNARKCKQLKSNKSGYKGVCSVKNSSNWYVSLKVNGKTKYMGSYKDIIYASRVYATAVLITVGEIFDCSEPFDVDSDDYKLVQSKL